MPTSGITDCSWLIPPMTLMKAGPVVCKHVESEGLHANDLLPLLQTYIFPWNPSAVLSETHLSIFMAVNPSPLSGVRLPNLEPQHLDPTGAVGVQTSSFLGSVGGQLSLW